MRKYSVLLVMIFVIGLVSFAGADVIIKNKTTTEAIGVTVSATSTQYIKGDKSRDVTVTVSDIPANPMMGGGETMTDTHINITRLDKNVEWEVIDEEKIYIETPIPEDEGEELPDEMSESEQPEFMDAEKYDWKVEVKDINEAKTIAGFKCKGIKSVATGTSKEDPAKKLRLSFTYWYSSDVPGYAEVKAFHDKKEKLSGHSYYDMGDDEFFDGFGESMKELSDKMENANGMPIQIEVAASGTFNPMGDIMAQGMGGMDIDQMPPEYKDMMSKMMESMKPKQTADGMYQFMSSVTTLESAEKKSVSDSEFEVPSEYEKVEY